MGKRTDGPLPNADETGAYRAVSNRCILDFHV